MNKSTDSDRGQVQASAAEVYDTFFVPALFGQWPPKVLKVAGVEPGDAVLDIGCGTGVLAKAAARLTDPERVSAVDINEGMLGVARRSPEPIGWQQSPAEELPFPDRSFDRVLSQFAMMFFEDQAAAAAEMSRVARIGGTVTVVTWSNIEESPGYAAMVDLLRRLFGDEVAAALLAPFSLGTPELLHQLLADTFDGVSVTRHEGAARFDSLADWIHTDIRGWTLAELIDDDQYAELLAAAPEVLNRFVDDDGRVAFPAPALIASATVHQ